MAILLHLVSNSDPISDVHWLLTARQAVLFEARQLRHPRLRLWHLCHPRRPPALVCRTVSAALA